MEPGDDHGCTLPRFTVNLIVSDIYSDSDFAALRTAGFEFMLHADHAYDRYWWHGELPRRVRRGLGAELRLSDVAIASPYKEKGGVNPPFF
jgi:hypothetical protein